MALRSTIYKAELVVSDMDRGYYAEHVLTLARHPSETEERLMVRLVAFALHADPQLVFGNGLSTHDEPDLWSRDLTGAIRLWIDVGLPDDKLIRRACGRAERVVVLGYGGSRVEQWWARSRVPLSRLENLTVLALPTATTDELQRMAARNLRLNCSIQDGEAWFNTDTIGVAVQAVALKSAERPGFPGQSPQ
ncbi:MAG TPA: YaeQ family protein [Burkholderiaceae bacterium]|jgi:uncharacterized protein YaeQ|nr:YaeQ family protein [Burkholderiaceae bacterium]